MTLHLLLLLHCYCMLCSTACFCNEHTSIDHGCHNWPEPSITTVIVQDYRGTLTDRKQGEAETDLVSPVCVYCDVGRRSEGCSMTSFSVLVSIYPIHTCTACSEACLFLCNFCDHQICTNTRILFLSK